MKYFLSFLFLITFASLVYADSFPVRKNDILTFAVTLEAAAADDINAIDMIMYFDNTMFKIINVTLTNGLLDENYTLTWLDLNNKINASVMFDLNAEFDDLVNGTGTAFFITGQVIGDIFNTGQIFVESFVRNETESLAGFEFQGKSYEELSFAVVPCDSIPDNKIDMADAIYLLNVLSEKISPTDDHCPITLESLIDILRTLTNNFYLKERRVPRSLHIRSDYSQNDPTDQTIPFIYSGIGDKITLPIVLNNEMDIDGALIHINLNTNVFAVDRVSLANGILYGRNFSIKHNIVDDQLKIVIYTNGHCYYGKGAIAYLTFEVIDNNCATESIYLSRFDCNETNMIHDSGLYIAESIHNRIDVHIRNLTLAKPIPNLEFHEDAPVQSISLSERFVDICNPDADIHTIIFANSQPDLISVTQFNNALLLDSADNKHGKTAITVVAMSDSERLTDIFHVCVRPVDDPPVISGIDDQTIIENTSTDTIPIVLHDIDTPVNQIKLKAHSSNLQLVSSTGIQLGGFGARRLLKIVPKRNTDGIATISLIASDQHNRVTTEFLLDVQHKTYTISSVIGTGGSINQPDVLTVSSGDTVKYRAIPDSEYKLENTVLDQKYLGAVSEYIFTNINANHHLEFIFSEASYYTISALSGSGGEIVPSGIIHVCENHHKTFKIMPEPGYAIDTIWIDNQPIKPTNQYTFKKIQSAHKLDVQFKPVDAPEANFTCIPTHGLPSLEVHFTNQSVNEIAQYRWDFGDGTHSSQKNPEHTFSMPGSYTVSLTVTGPGGTDMMIKPNRITVQSNYIDFKSNIQAGPAPLTVSFNDTSKGYTISHWDFGDGHTLDTQYPAHVYETPGIYTVSASSNGITKIIKNYIAVQGRYITGLITNRTPDCLIQIKNKKFEIVGKTFSDAQGCYTVSNLMPLTDVSLCVWPPNNSSLTARCLHGLNLQSDHITNLNISLNEHPTGTITGHILNSHNNGVADMPVFIESENLDFKQSTQSNAQGLFAFSNLAPATDYRIFSKMPLWPKTCYYGESETVYHKNEADLLNLNNQEIKNINIWTPDTGDISGQIFVSGSPTKGIWVKARSSLLKTGNAARSDANGQYTIVGLIAESDGNPITYIVDIQQSGYSYQAYSLVTSQSIATPVTAGSNHIDFYLYDTFSISGKVIDINNIPLSHVEITVWSDSTPSLKNSRCISDSNGQYTLDHLPLTHDYQVSAFSDNFPVHHYENQIDLSSGNVGNIDFVLDKGPVIHGIIYLQSDNGQKQHAGSGIRVTIESKTNNTVQTCRTESDGWFEFTGLFESVDDYILSVQHDGYMSAYFAENGINSTVYEKNNASRLSPSDDIREIVLKSGYHITGNMTYLDQPIADIRIKAWDETTGGFAFALSTDRINNESNFILKDLPPGTYELSINSDQFKDQILSNVLLNSDIDGLNISLEKPDRNITGSIHGLLSGDILKIAAYSRDTNVQQVQHLQSTGTEMAYTFSHLKPASDYRVDLIYRNQTYHHKDIDLTMHHAEGIDFIISSNSYEITGVITFPDHAIDGEYVWIHAVSSSSQTDRRIKVHYNGQQSVVYTFSDLKPGRDYIVCASSPVYLKQPFLDNPVQIIDQSVHHVDFDLQKGNQISGIVYENGNPAVNVMVSARSEKTGGFGNTITSFDGSYTIAALVPSDDYIIAAKHSGLSQFYFNSNEASVSNVDLATYVDISIDHGNMLIFLDQLETISGTIQSADGQLLKDMTVMAWSEILKMGNTAFSSSDGSYKIKGLKNSNDYCVHVIPENSSPYVVQKKDNISTNSQDVDFILSTGYTLKGQIMHSTQMPLAGIIIEIRSNALSINKQDRSDSEGNYAINGLPDGNDYQISTLVSDHHEYLSYNIENVLIDRNVFHDVILMPSTMQDSSSESISQSYTGIITGMITNNNGLPIENVSIRLFSESSGVEKIVLSDINGQFILSELNAYQNGAPVTDFILTATYPGYPSQTKQYFQDGDDAAFVFTDLGITGSVRDIDGNFIPEGFVVNVMLFEANVSKIPIKKVLDRTNSDFHFIGLDANTDYQLLFHIHTTSVKQWAGENHEGIALDSRHDAAFIKAGDEISFQFNQPWQEMIQ
jgi:PKD repeat protein